MILKQVIRYENADALEATWVERTEHPESGGFIEIVVKCQAYANNQMGMLAADLGADAPQYQALMDEIAATYVPPPPAPPYVPEQVTMRQARLALLGAGLLSSVDAAIASLPSPQKEAAQIEWEYAAVVQRNSGLVPAMAQALGMSEAQIDELFITAAAL